MLGFGNIGRFGERTRCRVPACLLLVFAWLASQTPAVAAEHSEASRAVDTMVAQFAHTNAPGVSVAVYRAGNIVYAKATGMADLDHRLPLTTRSVFDIASMSKQFTAMAVVLLTEDGKLSLDDPITKYIPEVDTGGATITIRELLQHTSGIRDYLDLMGLAGEAPEARVVSQSDVLAVLARQKHLNFVPGAAFRYENTSYALMATLVKRVSGVPLRIFAAKRIFGPLGMTSTAFHDDHTDVIGNRALGYEPRENGWSEAAPLSDEVGDGGVWTTVEDLAKWDRNFYEPRIGGVEALGLLQSPAKLADGRELSYALGLFIDTYHGFKMVSHGGVDPGYRAQMLRFPDERLTVCVLANNPEYDVEGLARRIADVFLPTAKKPVAERKAVPPVADTGAWAGYAGKYLDLEIGRVREVLLKDGVLTVRSGGKDFPLEPTGSGNFSEANGVIVSFEPTRQSALRMTVVAPGGMPSVSLKLPDTAPLADGNAYLGRYASTELGVAWQVTMDGQALSLDAPGNNSKLIALDKDVFQGDPGLISFVRGADGRVIGFTVSNVRDSGIAFARSSASGPREPGDDER